MRKTCQIYVQIHEKHATNIRYSTIMCNMGVIVFIIIIRRNSRYEYKALEPVRHLLGKSRHTPVTPSAVYLCNIFFPAAAALCRIICSTAVTPYFEPPKPNKYGETVTVGRSERTMTSTGASVHFNMSLITQLMFSLYLSWIRKSLSGGLCGSDQFWS